MSAESREKAEKYGERSQKGSQLVSRALERIRAALDRNGREDN